MGIVKDFLNPRERHSFDNDLTGVNIHGPSDRINQEINNPYALTPQERWERDEAIRIRVYVAPRLTYRRRVLGFVNDFLLISGRFLNLTKLVLEIVDAIMTLWAAGRSFFNLMRKLRQLLPPAKANEIIRIVTDRGKTPPRPNDPFSNGDRSWQNDFNPRNITPNSLPVTGGRTGNRKTPDWNTFDLDSYRRALTPSTQRPWGC
ncbi:hypothetical protein VB712_04800 [Spirulina sp. CCNP1310]|uniref:hypothetical protein n=1 Tax=Spirulina sp. CCNP1310 TaxID=3110249 RepID=UPI002B209B23|nr:hypothetical protein [Spirulina sp. CCNP1310]MEA5418535.1 hypothetical protein [Spirulina sp. CCNP1310]